MRRPLAFVVGLILILFLGFVIFASPVNARTAYVRLAQVPVHGCTATDGDTLRCANWPVAIRLSGIDAPEMPGHCAAKRNCVPGDPYLAKDNLARLLTRSDLMLEQVAVPQRKCRSAAITARRDAMEKQTGLGNLECYGRTVGIIWSGSINTSCAQLAAGLVIFRKDWDTGHLIARDCTAR